MIEVQKRSYEENCNSIVKTLNIAIQNADPLTNQIEDLEQAKRIILSLRDYYKDLNDLCKRLQDNMYAEFEDYNFEIEEQDTNSLSYILDLVDGFTNGMECEQYEK